MSLLSDVTRLKQEALEQIDKADSAERLTEVQVRYLGRKGAITAVLKSLKDLPLDEKKQTGAAANQARAELEQKIEEARQKLVDETAENIKACIAGEDRNIVS